MLEVIREKEGDFRSGRNDFSARLGGTSLDVRRTHIHTCTNTHTQPHAHIVASLHVGVSTKSGLMGFSSGHFQVPVPRFAVGIVIGRNGEMIKKIQNDAGVRIQFKAGLFTPE